MFSGYKNTKIHVPFTELNAFRYVHHVSLYKLMFNFTARERKHFWCNSFSSNVDSASCAFVSDVGFFQSRQYSDIQSEKKIRNAEISIVRWLSYWST